MHARRHASMQNEAEEYGPRLLNKFLGENLRGTRRGYSFPCPSKSFFNFRLRNLTGRVSVRPIFQLLER